MVLKDIAIRHFKGLEEVTLTDCGPVNALIGKNNSGKSSILHAIDMAGLALSSTNWGKFQPRLELKDLFTNVGDFEIALSYRDDAKLNIKTDARFGPILAPEPHESQRFKTLLITPDPDLRLTQRSVRAPKQVVDDLNERNYSSVNALQILYAIKFYAERNQRGFSQGDYDKLIHEVRHYFPDLEDIDSDRTDQDMATLLYREYGRQLDILYSGTGLKHFLDVLLKTTVSGANIVLLDEPEHGLHPDLQRQFVEYLARMAAEKNIQFFMATHSPVLLNYADQVTYFRVTNAKGKRAVTRVDKDLIHTILSDLGLRPSDLLNQDMCLMVEGASDVIFFEHVIRKLYKNEFDKLAIGILQYGGGAAESIISGAINVSNIVGGQKFTLWVRDLDSNSPDSPSSNTTRFKNALDRQKLECLILKKREIEYYYPEAVHVAAQQGDAEKEAATRGILSGDQSRKYDVAAKDHGICVPGGKYLRTLLERHLTTKNQLDPEIRELVENRLFALKKQILGETES